jgi:hypothetical protein
VRDVAAFLQRRLWVITLEQLVDWVSVVDNDTDDFVSGGDGTDDVYVVDLVDGARDDFSDTCEMVYQTASIPQE